MQRLVAGRLSVGVLVIPVAADVVGHFETIERDALVLQALGRREARAAGPDDARPRVVFHRSAPSPPADGHGRMMARSGMANQAAGRKVFSYRVKPSRLEYRDARDLE